MFGGPEGSYRQTYSARDWLSILRTPYPTQNFYRKHRTDSQMTTKVSERTMNPGLMKTGVWNVRGLYSRNEVTETSGRLHPLWPQNNWLHTLRTTDYRHTRQDRWIQMELVFILAKNATKPNPFEIIPLQTTRKENNWKTEEALARVAVTLETERIKGSNPWYLCWWEW